MPSPARPSTSGVLGRCPSLVYADPMISHTTLATIPSFSGDVPVLVHLPQLLRLCIGDTDLLRVMSPPNLRDIVVQKVGPGHDAFRQLLELIRRDHPPLSSISLVNSTLVTANRVSILMETRMLETLRIHAAAGTSARSASSRMVKSRRAITPAAQENSKSNLCQPIRRVIIRTTPKKTLSASTIKDLKGLAGTVSFSQHLPFGRGAV
ncbi:hypothetical protein B0H14DRAFT_574563 [Mycena olivaceomarginata]|nr:hypothetical protein B0H14DRAFT_574563 [Mycena olivaceomarginata]